MLWIGCAVAEDGRTEHDNQPVVMPSGTNRYNAIPIDSFLVLISFVYLVT